MDLSGGWEIGIISKQAESFAFFQSEFRRFLETFQTARESFLNQMGQVKSQIDQLKSQLDRISDNDSSADIMAIKHDLAECRAKVQSIENCLQRADGLQGVLQKNLADLLDNIDQAIEDKIERIKNTNELKYWKMASIAGIVLQIILAFIVIFIKKGI